MDEEQMWKGFFDKLHELKMNPPTEHEQQLQDGDDGFFEKFGMLLRQKSQLDDTVLKTSLAPFKDEEDEDQDVDHLDEHHDDVQHEELESSTDSGLEATPVKDFSSIDAFPVESVRDATSADEIKDAFLNKAIGMNRICSPSYEVDVYSHTLVRLNENESSSYAFKWAHGQRQDILDIANN